VKTVSAAVTEGAVQPPPKFQATKYPAWPGEKLAEGCTDKTTESPAQKGLFFKRITPSGVSVEESVGLQ
jgi:hypothetical protein